jgi:hypothetical protein
VCQSIRYVPSRPRNRRWNGADYVAGSESDIRANAINFTKTTGMRRVVLENVVARQRQSDRAQHPPDSRVIVLLPINDAKTRRDIRFG